MVEKRIEVLKAMFWIILGLLVVTIFFLIKNYNWIESVVVLIGSLAFIWKFKIELNVIGYQKNENIENQKNIIILKNDIDTVTNQYNEFVNKQAIYNSGVVKNQLVQNQIVYSSGNSIDDKLMEDIKSNMDTIDIELRYNGGLDGPFLTKYFDDLCIFIETLSSTKYNFVDKKLNIIFVSLKKKLEEFYSLYKKNLVSNDKNPFIGVLKYNHMIQWKWKNNYSDKDFDEANKDMNRINALLGKILQEYQELFDKYRE